MVQVTVFRTYKLKPEKQPQKCATVDFLNSFSLKIICEITIQLCLIYFIFSDQVQFFTFGATAPIWALAYLHETLRFTSVY
jgi:hypothetical protein